MDISLTPELERLVNEKIHAGEFKTASEVICEGLKLLGERDADQEDLRAEIRAGSEAAERGEYTEYDVDNVSELAMRIQARGRQRIAEEELQTGTR